MYQLVTWVGKRPDVRSFKVSTEGQGLCIIVGEVVGARTAYAKESVTLESIKIANYDIIGQAVTDVIRQIGLVVKPPAVE
jgi:hypothetical protein